MITESDSLQNSVVRTCFVSDYSLLLVVIMSTVVGSWQLLPNINSYSYSNSVDNSVDNSVSTSPLLLPNSNYNITVAHSNSVLSNSYDNSAGNKASASYNNNYTTDFITINYTSSEYGSISANSSERTSISNYERNSVSNYDLNTITLNLQPGILNFESDSDGEITVCVVQNCSMSLETFTVVRLGPKKGQRR